MRSWWSHLAMRNSSPKRISRTNKDENSATRLQKPISTKKPRNFKAKIISKNGLQIIGGVKCSARNEDFWIWVSFNYKTIDTSRTGRYGMGTKDPTDFNTWAIDSALKDYSSIRQPAGLWASHKPKSVSPLNSANIITGRLTAVAPRAGRNVNRKDGGNRLYVCNPWSDRRLLCAAYSTCWDSNLPPIIGQHPRPNSKLKNS